MIATRATLWTSFCLTISAWLMANPALFCQPEPNILRVVLSLPFDDDGVPRDVKIVSASENLGVLREAPSNELIWSQIEEGRAGTAALVRYTLEDSSAVIEIGHFLVGRQAHAEVLDARRGGIVRRLEGSMNEVIVRVPIPLHRPAKKLTIGIVDSASVEDLEDLDEAPVVSAVSADLPMSSSAGQALSSLIDSHLIGSELIHPSGGVASPGGFNIVFLGDGFTDASLWLYQEEVEAIKKEITENTYPVSALKHAINIWRVDLVTTEDWTSDNLPDEGVDVPVIGVDEQSGEELSCTGDVLPVDRPNVLGTHFCGRLSDQAAAEYSILGSENWLAIYAFADLATQYYDDYIIVLANSADFGGAGYWTSDDPASEVTGPVAIASVASARGCAPDANLGSSGTAENGSSEQGCGLPLQGWDRPYWRPVIHSMTVHEFGHAAFELGDEYCNSVQIGQSWCCEASEEYGGVEPWHPNMTKSRSFTELVNAGKWSKLVVPSPVAVLPHRVPGCETFECPPDCGCCLCPDECECPEDCDCPDSGCPARLVPPLPPDLVGLFEGATFEASDYGCGLFRPRHECKMNWDTKVSFCPVCRDAILKVVAPYVGNNVYVQFDSLTVKNFEVFAEPVESGRTGLFNRDLGSAESPGTDYKFQVAAGWVSSSSTQAPGSTLPPNVDLGDFQPIPKAVRYGADLFLSFERPLAVLGPAPAVSSPKIRVSYRVLGPDSAQVTSGSFDLEPETGVHIEEQKPQERPDGRLRFTISVVTGAS